MVLLLPLETKMVAKRVKIQFGWNSFFEAIGVVNFFHFHSDICIHKIIENEIDFLIFLLFLFLKILATFNRI